MTLTQVMHTASLTNTERHVLLINSACSVQFSREVLKNICSKMENVFEQFIEVPKRIDIKEILKRNSALGVCMSGSGPTVFGIFENKEDAEKAAYELKDIAKDIDICTPVRKGCKIMEITE